ncbi:GH16275 [Drosophila grimshawi]|uniref:GH16275 n=2 Tax=Drosophila grimshawi TaxID=7222 RepID=B4IXX6_DROGR|nr:GH16275 [Drosophila grimshawi]
MSELNATVGSFNMRELPMLAHKFVTCTDLSIDEDERLPSELCQACHTQLDQLYAFRAKCIAADTKWRMQILAFCDDEELVYDLEVAPSTLEVDELQLEQSSEIADRTESKCDIQRTETSELEIENLVCESPALIEEADEEMDVVTSTWSTETKDVYKCDMCAAQFLNEQRLLSHKRRHGKSLFPCPEPGCDRGYSHKHTLTLHMRKCHKLGKEHKSYVCEFCGKLFDTISLLNTHRFTHKDKLAQPFACEDPNCERRFSTKQLLKIHMMRHAGIKNYTCSYCGVQKTTRTELKIHLNYHTLERTYACHLCSTVCYSSSNLNKHIRTIHERARNYLCRYCERAFIQPETRNQHELIHTGEKPHECVECGRRFRQKAALRSHYKIHARQLKELESAQVADAVDTAADDDDGIYVPEMGEEIEYD